MKRKKSKKCWGNKEKKRKEGKEEKEIIKRSLQSVKEIGGTGMESKERDYSRHNTVEINLILKKGLKIWKDLLLGLQWKVFVNIGVQNSLEEKEE